MNKVNKRKYISSVLTALVILQSVPVLSITASASTVLNQGGVSDTIQWAVITEDNGEKTLKITGTGAIPAQVPGQQAWVNYATDVTRLEISEGITSINVSAFNGSIPNVTEIVLPDTLQTIYSKAFNGCKITEITLGANVKALDGNPFAGIETLETINVDEHNPVFKSYDGVLYNYSNKSLVSYPRAKTSTDLVIPESILSIGVSALAENTYIKHVTGPDVVLVYEYGFAGCTNLESTDFPQIDGLRSYAYKDCSSLKKAIILPSTPPNTYYNCNGLKEVEINGRTQYLVNIVNRNNGLIAGNLSQNPGYAQIFRFCVR